MEPEHLECETPTRQMPLTDDHRVQDAVRIVAALEGSDEPAALRSLRAAAERAGVGVEEIARGVVLFHGL